MPMHARNPSCDVVGVIFFALKFSKLKRMRNLGIFTVWLFIVLRTSIVFSQHKPNLNSSQNLTACLVNVGVGTAEIKKISGMYLSKADTLQAYYKA